jgi:hypothetical protein
MDAHSREYAAAAAGMADTYGRPLPAVGDYVNGKSGPRRWSGVVISISERTVIVDVGHDARVEAPVEDICNF